MRQGSRNSPDVTGLSLLFDKGMIAFIMNFEPYIEGKSGRRGSRLIAPKIISLRLFSLFLAGFFSGCDSPDNENTWLSGIVQKAGHSVAKVYAIGEDGRGKAGTGFAININSEAVILTGKHVVHGAKIIIVETENDTWLAEKWSEHSDLDMAKISLNGREGITKLDVAPPDNLRMGDAVATLGYPLGYGLAIHEGIVSSVDGLNVVFSAPLSTGASGSPLLNKNGQVVGICYSFINDAQNYNLAIPSELFSVKTSWETVFGDADREIRVYLKTIQRIKEFQRRCMQEWEMIGEEFPDYKPWIGQTQSTRRNLLKAIEGLSMAVHGIDWQGVGGVGDKIGHEAVRLRDKLEDMRSAWNLHIHNINVANELFETRTPIIPPADFGFSLFQEASVQLTEVASGHGYEKWESKKKENVKALLLSYFRQELCVLKSGVP